MPADDGLNVLLLFTDQHRLSAVGCCGETPCETPYIDRLAAEGVRFETAYCACPVCSPTRGSVMTGLYPHAHGICSNVHNLGCSVHELPDGPDLLSRRLGAAGVACGYTGKWHLGTDSPHCFTGPNTPCLPKDVGFDGQNFPGHGGGGFKYPEYEAYLRDHGWTHAVRHDGSGRPLSKCRGVLEGPVESTVPYFLAENTIALLDRYAAGDAPFFLWHNNWGPHAPYFAPEEYVARYRDVEIPPWPNYEWAEVGENRPHQVKRHPDMARGGLAWEDWAETIRHYYAFTSLIDDQFGRILKHLEETGLAENTAVIFTADHGETLGSHGGLTDKGWHHFEEIQRIPFVVRMPERFRGVDPGTVLPQWVSNLDLYPTILDLAGADTGRTAPQGRSLAPLLRGEAPADWRDEIFVEFNGVNSLATNMITCRHGDLKYGWNGASFDEMYDLARDPHELHNCIDDAGYADAVEAFRARILRFMEETGYSGMAVNMYRQTRMGACNM